VVPPAESICILAGMLPLIAGYIQFNFFPGAIGCFLIGLLWLFSQRRRWVWVAPLGLSVFVIAAGLGVWIGLSPYLMAFSVMGSLFAWDLADFSRRLRGAAPDDDLRQLIKMHLLRLTILGIICMSLSLVALVIHFRLSFGWIFLLSLVAVLGMMQLVNRLRRE
jgi:hypothetical protein